MRHAEPLLVFRIRTSAGDPGMQSHDEIAVPVRLEEITIYVATDALITFDRTRRPGCRRQASRLGEGSPSHLEDFGYARLGPVDREDRKDASFHIA